jgi:2-methylcitrate dehydratase PrpD
MCRPLERRRAPATAVDAKFSLPFLVAVAALRRTIVVSDFEDATRRDPEVLATAQKVVPIADPSLDWKFDMLPGRVEILTHDGRSFTRVGEGLPGSAEAPMTWDQVAQKFSDCASAAVIPPSVEQIREAQEIVEAFELQENAARLVRVLSRE